MTEKSKLTECDTCEGLVAKTARKCPHCGASLNYGSNKRIVKGVLWIGIPLILMSFIGSFSDSPGVAPSNPTYDLRPEKERCRNEISKAATHPSTVDFFITQIEAQRFGDGTARVLQGFSAKNSFNLTTKYTGRCLFGKTGKFLLTIEEQK